MLALVQGGSTVREEAGPLHGGKEVVESWVALLRAGVVEPSIQPANTAMEWGLAYCEIIQKVFVRQALED